MMSESKFWTIIDSSREAARKLKRKPGEDFFDLHERTLADALRKLSPEEIVAYEERFDELHARAYRWDLWAVAYWMHGGCGDDGFMDFRACLISLGKERFNKALKDPDSLADIIGLPDIPYMQAEGFQYIGHKVYEELTGEEDFPDYENHHPQEPVGERIDHDDEDVMREHFPKLLAKLPEMGD